MNIWGKLANAVGWTTKDQPAECEYGDRIGAEDNCKIIVPAYQGVRESGTVFCSADHAALAQQESLI